MSSLSLHGFALRREGGGSAPAYRDASAGTGPVFGTSLRKTNVVRERLTEGTDAPRWWRVYRRLIQLLSSLVIWYLATLVDRLIPSRRHDARLRGARRLRARIEMLGGTMIKLGQQASLRSDLLPEEYCDALADMLDKNPAFPVSEAYAAIEEQTGRPWQETFAAFDPEPVGSASIACVYWARLYGGEEVAVKVRRPGIRATFAVDIAALKKLAQLLEFLTLVPPRLLGSFTSELEGVLNAELDFVSEIRHQELFRRYLARRKKFDVTAPKINYALCGRKVIVSEFVSGFWLKKMIERLNAGDHRYMATLRSNGIYPRQIARRLIRAQYYQFHECPLFHGDPHPGNIVVQPGGRIVMVDFGACGVFSGRDRNLMLRMHYYYARGDVAGMVQCVLGLMEPMPQIDVEAFSRRLQDEWWEGYYGIRSRHAHRSERTSFRLWLAMLRAFREFAVPMPARMIPMVRATLLYDTVAAALDPKINVFREFHKYYEHVARRVRIRTEEAVIRQLLLGPDDAVFVKAQRVMDVADALLFRAEKYLAEPDIGFEAALRKVYVLIESAAQMTKTILGLAAVLAPVAVAAFVTRQLLALVHVVEPASIGWRPVDIMRGFNPWSSDADPVLMTFTWIWIVLAVMTVWSTGSRVLSQFLRKDDYPYQHRIG